MVPLCLLPTVTLWRTADHDGTETGHSLTLTEFPEGYKHAGSYQGIIAESSYSDQFMRMKLTTENAKRNYRMGSLTLGEFIERAYVVYGKRKAKGFVRLAIKSHLIEFRNHSLG